MIQAPTRTATRLALAAALVVSVLLGLAGPAAAARSGEDDRSPERLYRAYFLREPDESGLSYWQDLRWRGETLTSISSQFATSREFIDRYGELDDAEFVRLVYDNVLGRAPDDAGLAYWQDMLRRGRTRGWVMLGFSDSAEFKEQTGLSGVDGPDAVTFFRSIEPACRDHARDTSNLEVPSHYFTDARPVRPVGIDQWLVLDGVGYPFVVHLGDRIAHPPWTRDAVVPWEYSFGCPPDVVMGSISH